MACRFCVQQLPMLTQDPCYMSVLVTGSFDRHTLPKLLEKVESKGVLPSVTIWCEGCGRVSVISHLYHLFLNGDRSTRADAASDSAPTVDPTTYYSRLLVDASLLYGFQINV